MIRPAGQDMDSGVAACTGCVGHLMLMLMGWGYFHPCRNYAEDLVLGFRSRGEHGNEAARSVDLWLAAFHVDVAHTPGTRSLKYPAEKRRMGSSHSGPLSLGSPGGFRPNWAGMKTEGQT